MHCLGVCDMENFLTGPACKIHPRYIWWVSVESKLLDLMVFGLKNMDFLMFLCKGQQEREFPVVLQILLLEACHAHSLWYLAAEVR